MTTMGVTDLDMNATGCVVHDENIEYVQRGKSTTMIKFMNGNKLQLNGDCDVLITRRGQHPIHMGSANQFWAKEDATELHPGLLTAFFIAITLLVMKAIK